ncbi:MAG: exo-alpha-sialidase, partial [Burkholderiaceae bacterium]
LPQDHACHLVYRHGMDVTADGRSLAIASTTGALWASADAGESWVAVSRDLPPVAALRFVPAAAKAP